MKPVLSSSGPARYGAGLLTMLLAISVANATTASADPDPGLHADRTAVAGVDLPDVPQAIIGDALTKEELVDLEFIAESTGESLESTIARVAWQQDFAMLATALQEKFPDEFAGAKIEPEGDPWIAFRAKVPDEATRMVAGFNEAVFSQTRYAKSDGDVYSVELRPDAGFSEAELDARLTDAHYAVLATDDVVADANSAYDITTGEILVQVELKQEYAKQGAEPLLVALRDKGVDLDGVSVQVVGDVLRADDSLYGGQSMTTCTAGFTVVRNGSTRGLVTAAHCPDTQSQGGYSLTFQQAHQGTWGDFQWHISAAYEADDFYAGNLVTNASDLRDVGSRGNAVVGQDLCRNGKTTRKNCDVVYQLNHCSGNDCHLTAMQNDTGEDGDSGGPWYWGTVAYGVHKGAKYWFGSRDVFTPQQYIDDGISGLVVATT